MSGNVLDNKKLKRIQGIIFLLSHIKEFNRLNLESGDEEKLVIYDLHNI